MRLINATALHPEWYGLHGTDLCNAYKMIDEAQTFDAVPVIRCKDCKYYHAADEDEDPEDSYCEMTFCSVGLDDFCSDAEHVEKPVGSVDK